MKNNGAISWAARSQSKVAHSSADSELRALDECIREARWLQRLDTEFYPARATGRPDHKQPITVYEDNRLCIKWIENPCQHSKVKHIDVPLKFIRDDVTVDKTLDLVYINTKAQCADLFTKQLSPKVHWTLAKNIMNIPNTHTNLPQSADCTALHSNCHDLFYPDATSSDAPEGGYRAGSSYCLNNCRTKGFNNCRTKGTGPQ